MTQFEILIEELGKALSIPLKSENQTICALSAEGKFSVQIEEKEETLFLVAFLAELPPGKFREEVLLEGLKHNYEENQKKLFGFISKKSMLTLEQRLKPTVSVDKLKSALLSLIDLGKVWKDAIDLGNLTSIRKPTSSSLISPLNLHP